MVFKHGRSLPGERAGPEVEAVDVDAGEVEAVEVALGDDRAILFTLFSEGFFKASMNGTSI